MTTRSMRIQGTNRAAGPPRIGAPERSLPASVSSRNGARERSSALSGNECCCPAGWRARERRRKAVNGRALDASMR